MSLQGKKRKFSSNLIGEKLEYLSLEESPSFGMTNKYVINIFR
jgi:hypothetical protein